MKTSQKKALLILGIIFLASLLNLFIPSIFKNFNYVVLLILVVILLKYRLGINLKRNANDIKISRNILIYVITYYLITYLAGFFIGFIRNIYNYNISNILMNILPSIISIVLIEIIRGELIHKTNKDKLIIIFSIFVFSLFEISININDYNLYIQSSLYEFIGLLVMGSITSNILLTLIHLKTDKYPAMIYRFLMETKMYIILIEPDLGPYLKSTFLILLPIVISIMLLNMEKKVKDKPKDKKSNKKYYAVLIVLLLLVLINSGLLKYQSLVIGSNSMYPYIRKGDVVLIEKTTNPKKINKGDILAYKYDGKIIVHRITLKTVRDNKVYYKTKGDNNDQEDLILISPDKVKGKVLFRVKFIGLPSIWLNDLFK